MIRTEHTYERMSFFIHFNVFEIWTCIYESPRIYIRFFKDK